jgi:preprotein translocase SecE subunit
VGRLLQYIDDVELEMKRVSWPTWRQARSITLVVLFFNFAMTRLVMVVDSICALLYPLVVEK